MHGAFRMACTWCIGTQINIFLDVTVVVCSSLGPASTSNPGSLSPVSCMLVLAAKDLDLQPLPASYARKRWHKMPAAW